MHDDVLGDPSKPKAVVKKVIKMSFIDSDSNDPGFARPMRDKYVNRCRPSQRGRGAGVSRYRSCLRGTAWQTCSNFAL